MSFLTSISHLPRRAPRTAHRGLSALLCGTLLWSSGCGKPVRRKDPPPELMGVSAMEPVVPLPSATAELPEPTLSHEQVRRALWDIAVQRARGDASLALDEYSRRFQSEGTLESRFLAAMAIPDDEAQWEALKAILDAQPRYVWAHAAAAHVYARWKLRDQCEKQLAKALDLDAELGWSYLARAELHRRLGETDAALEAADAALQIDEQDADARFMRAQLLRSRDGDRFKEYRSELERAIKDVPSHAEAAEALALYLDAQESPEAVQAWLRMEKLAPRNRTVKLALARLRAESDVSGAITAYEDASKLKALTAAEQSSLCKLYRTAGRTADEKPCLQGLTKLVPTEVAPWRRLAEIAEAGSDAAGAEEAHRAVLGQLPKDGTSLWGLGKVLEQRKQIRPALESFRGAMAGGEARAKVDIQRLAEACQLPARPLAATSLEKFYVVVNDSLVKAYNKRLLEAPRLAGRLKVAIQSDGQGKLLGLEVRENTLGDPWLEAHLFFALTDAAWPRFATDPSKKVVLTFDLPPVLK